MENIVCNKGFACDKCGNANSDRFDKRDGFYVCRYCGHSMQIESAEGFYDRLINHYTQEKRENLQKNLKNYRQIVSDELKNHIISQKSTTIIIDYSLKIIELIDDDFLSRFYIAFVKRDTYPKEFCDFLARDLGGVDRFALQQALEFLCCRAEIKFKKDIVKFILNAKIANIDCDNYLKMANDCLEQAQKDTVRYSQIPRDVFICHVSNDEEIASMVHKALLKANISCFFAPYNLTKLSQDDFWKALEWAIEHSKVFLVISSYHTEYNDINKNGAIREMNHAESFPKLKRLEFKIDNPKTYTRTPKFHHFFTNPWIDAHENPTSALPTLFTNIQKSITAHNTELHQSQQLQQLQQQQLLQQLQQQFQQQFHQPQPIEPQPQQFQPQQIEPQPIVQQPIVQQPIQPKPQPIVPTIKPKPIEIKPKQLPQPVESKPQPRPKLNDYIIENGVLKKYKGKDSKITIPSGVTVIDWSAFKNCTSLTSIEIPSGVTKIGRGAFEGCTSLTSIEIPSGVTQIGDWAFDGCTNLSSVKIPYGVTEIGWGAFMSCKSLTSIQIPSGVTKIGSLAFEDCTSLTSIKIPSGVTKIGDLAFKGCTSLSSLTIPSDVTEIGLEAFSGCKSLTSIEIPSGVTGIGGNAFEGCRSLTSVEIPSGVTRIGKEIFKNCTSLTSIKIPSSIKYVGYEAFYGNKRLTVYVDKLQAKGWGRGWKKGFKGKVVYF